MSVTAGTILLDGLTLRSANRLLSNVVNHTVSTYSDHPEKDTYKRKCDYELNAAFRFGLDFACLAQFVQTVVTSDRIAYDPQNVPYPFLAGRLSPKASRAMKSILIPTTVRPVQRMALMKEATSATKRHLTTNAMAPFLKLLAETGVEGAFFQMSSGYFGTGFCDPEIADFGPFSSNAGWVARLRDILLARIDARIAKNEEYVARFKKLTEQSDRLWGSLTHLEKALEAPDLPAVQRVVNDMSLDSGFLDELSRVASYFDEERRSGRHYELLEECKTADRLLLNVNQVLSSRMSDKLLYGLGVSVRRDVFDAGPDVVRHALATQYYSLLSDFVGIPYSAHPLRSHLHSSYLLAQSGSPHLLMPRIADLLDESRTRRLTAVRPLLDGQLVTMRLPFVLAMALKQSDSPRDLLNATLDIRNSRSAKKFRKWLHRINTIGATGGGNLATLNKEVDGLRQLIGEWSGDPSSKSGLDIGLSAGGSVSGFSLGITAKKTFMVGDRRVMRKSHLRLLRSLSDVSDNTPRLDPLVKSVFGDQASNLWKKYVRSIEPAIMQKPSDVTLRIQRA
jgi:hypothetical protein